MTPIGAPRRTLEVAALRHLPTPSCLTGCLRDALEAGGLRLGDETVFGLGAGLFFGYGGVLQTRFFDAAVQAPWLEQCLFANLGLRYQRYELADVARGFERLLRLLEQGHAVPVLINPHGCPALLATVEPRLVPFLPAHWVVVHGYDAARGEVLLYDNRHFGAVRLDEAVFRDARGRGRGAQNPFNAWIEITPEADPLPLELGLRLALRQTARAFRAIEALHVKGAAGFHVGLDALRRFARQVPSYGRFMDVEQVRQTALRLHTSLSVAGAAKDGLRGLYARFLAVAAERLERPLLDLAAGAYRAAAQRWQRLNTALQDVATTPATLAAEGDGSALAALLRELVEAEQQALLRLEEALADDAAQGAGARLRPGAAHALG